MFNSHVVSLVYKIFTIIFSLKIVLHIIITAFKYYGTFLLFLSCYETSNEGEEEGKSISLAYCGKIQDFQTELKA